MRSMVAAGAHTPREKVFRPFFSCTTQWSPASFTWRVRAASPGGSSAQPSGAVRTVPSAARTVFGVGPGVKVLFILLQDSSWSPITVCRTVWTRQHDFVTIEITKPYLPMVRASIAIGRASVPWQEDFSAHRLGPSNRCVDVVNLEPKKQTVARRHVGRITNGSVMMFHFPAVQLQHQLAGINETFVF